MSTLKVTNIQATGETASRAVSGVAAAWVNFNGTGTIAARDSENVSSLTDNGTGDYTVNINNDMANGNYCVTQATAQTNDTGDGQRDNNANFAPTVYLAGSLRGFTAYTDSLQDAININIALLGDLS